MNGNLLIALVVLIELETWVKVKVSPLQSIKAHGDVDERLHIFTPTELV